jgi:hypothetical protein
MNAESQNETEHAEQVALARYLHGRGWLFTATANGASMAAHTRSRLAAAGLSRGVPDVLVFEPLAGYVGIAIELKRRKGGAVSPEQRRWLGWLAERGWLAILAHGADAAIQRIEEEEAR